MKDLQNPGGILLLLTNLIIRLVLYKADFDLKDLLRYILALEISIQVPGELKSIKACLL